MDVSDLLRHQLATLHYRTSRALEGAPDGFGEFSVGSGVRTPAELVRHMTDLVGYSRARLQMREGTPAEPASLSVGLDRLRREIVETIRVLGDIELSRNAVELLIQGPLADALTHTGQLAMLRRLMGSPIPGESYVEADIDADALEADALEAGGD